MKRQAGTSIVIAAAILACAAVAGIFISNNVDFLVRDRSRTAGSAEESAGPDRLSTSGQEGVEKGPRMAVPIPTVYCTLADREDITLRVSMTLFVSGRELRDEVLLKREDIRVIVGKVLAPKKLDDIVIETLREELKREIGTILDAGPVRDIEFSEFNPVL